VKIQSANYDTAKVNLPAAPSLLPIAALYLRSVDVGNTVAAQPQRPGRSSRSRRPQGMQIDAAISEADIGSVQEKQQVNFTVDAYPNRASSTASSRRSAIRPRPSRTWSSTTR